jgi:hypothetical protein
VGVCHPDHALLHPENAPGEIAELEDVALEALDRKVFVYGTDEGALGLEDYPEVGIVRDGAAGRDREHPCTPAPANPAVDRIVMD